MVATSIAALLVVIAFFIYLGWAFLFTAAELLVNGAVIYAIFLRSNVEIFKEGKLYFYLAGAASGLVVFAVAGNFLRHLLVWGITEWLVLSFVFAQAGIYGHKHYLSVKKSGRSK